MIKRFKIWLIHFLTKHLLHSLTEDDVLVISGRDYLYKTRKLTSDEILSLQEEAESFKRSTLWRLISQDIRFNSSLRMGEKAVSPDDMLFGKAMLFDLQLISQFIERLKKIK